MARTTSARPPNRPRRRSRPRPCASSDRSRRPGRSRTSSTWPGGRPRRTCSSSAIATDPASFDLLSRAGLNVQETANIIFDGAEAAVARINLDAEPGADLLAAIEAGHDDILSLQLVAIQGA